MRVGSAALLRGLGSLARRTLDFFSMFFVSFFLFSCCFDVLVLVFAAALEDVALHAFQRPGTFVSRLLRDDESILKPTPESPSQIANE
jgi:hypothetical protein